MFLRYDWWKIHLHFQLIESIKEHGEIDTNYHRKANMFPSSAWIQRPALLCVVFRCRKIKNNNKLLALQKSLLCVPLLLVWSFMATELSNKFVDFPTQWRIMICFILLRCFSNCNKRWCHSLTVLFDFRGSGPGDLVEDFNWFICCKKAVAHWRVRHHCNTVEKFCY